MPAGTRTQRWGRVPTCAAARSRPGESRGGRVLSAGADRPTDSWCCRRAAPRRAALCASLRCVLEGSPPPLRSPSFLLWIGGRCGSAACFRRCGSTCFRRCGRSPPFPSSLRLNLCALLWPFAAFFLSSLWIAASAASSLRRFVAPPLRRSAAPPLRRRAAPLRHSHTKKPANSANEAAKVLRSAASRAA